jgi:GTP cyclohydrolase I
MTLEEKIVSYADKLVETHERVPIELTVNRLREEKLNEAADRVQKIYDEITQIIGENP